MKRLKYVGKEPFDYFDATTDGVLRVEPGQVVEVADRFGAVLLQPAVGTFVVVPDIPEKPPVRSPRGGIGEPL